MPPPPAAIAKPPAVPAPSTHATMHSTWGAVKTDASCWYFSGPAGATTRLAGDAVFDRDGANVTMTFGGATFKGTYRDSVLELERKAGYVYQGRWTTRETIKGAYLAGKIVAHYRYEECQLGVTCDDRCWVDANLLLAI